MRRMMKSSLACVFLVCLFQASESRLSPRTLGVKGTATRRNLGGRRRNGNARAKRHRQQPDKSGAEASSHDENSSMVAPSQDESANKRSGGSGAPKSSAPRMASKNSQARKSTDNVDKSAESNDTVQPASRDRTSQDAETIDDSAKGAKSGGEQNTDGDKKQPRNKEGTLLGEDDPIGAMKLSPFAITFERPGGIPLTSDFAEAAVVAMEYLEPILFYVYDDALEFFTMADTRALYTQQQGPQINFDAAIKFIDGTSDPSDERVLGQIEKAFTDEAMVANFLTLLQRSLDPENPLQQSTGIIFHSQYYGGGNDGEYLRVQVSARDEESSVNAVGAFAGAALILAMSGYLIHGNHSNRDRMARLYKSCASK